MLYTLTCWIREPGGPCIEPMGMWESRKDWVNWTSLGRNRTIALNNFWITPKCLNVTWLIDSQTIHMQTLFLRNLRKLRSHITSWIFWGINARTIIEEQRNSFWSSFQWSNCHQSKCLHFWTKFLASYYRNLFEFCLKILCFDFSVV